MASVSTSAPPAIPRMRPAFTDVLLLFTLAMLSCVVLGPVLWHLNHWLYGIGQDGTSAVDGIAERLAATRQGGVLTPLTSILGAPFPEQGSGDAAAPLWWYGGVLLAFFLTPLTATNMLILLSFVLTTAAVYLFLRSNGLRPAPAALGAVVYGFCPTRLAQAQEHFGSLDDFWFVLECVVLLRLLRRPRLVPAVGLGVCIALAELDNPYLGYFAGVLAATTFALLLASVVYRKAWHAVPTVILGGSVALLVAVLIVLPMQYPLFQQVHSSGGAAASAGSLYRDIGDIDRLSLRWWNFFLPSPDNPIFGPLGRPIFFAHLGVDTVTEQSTMIGYVALALALVGARCALRVIGVQWAGAEMAATRLHKRLALRTVCRPGPFVPTGMQTRGLAMIAFVCIYTGVLFGMPPEFRFGPILVLTPPYFMHVVFPAIRTTARIDLLIQLGVAILVALGASMLLAKARSTGSRTFLTGILALAILLEYTNIPPWRFVRLLPAPPVYQWLASLTPAQAGIVVQYPIEAADLGRTPLYAFYAYDVHHHPLFNGVIPDTPPDALRRNLLDLLNPTNPASWAALGVKTLTVDTTYYDEAFHNARLDWSVGKSGFIEQLPVGLSLRHVDLTARGYAISTNPAAVVAGQGAGFGNAVLEQDGREWSWVSRQATIWLDNVTGSSVGTVLWTRVHNNGSAHELRWSGDMAVPISPDQQATTVAIDAIAEPGFHSFQIDVAGAEQPLAGGTANLPVSVELRSLEPTRLQPVDAEFAQGGKVTWRLTGFSTDACSTQTGNTVDVALMWSVAAPTAERETVFLHLLNSSGEIVAQGDNDPLNGTVDTRDITSGARLSDVHPILLPKTLPAGTYHLEVGLYNRQSMVRMAVLNGSDRIALGTVAVAPSAPGQVSFPCGW